MDKPSLDDMSVQEQLKSSPAPDWMVKMQEHYRRTGSFRSEDLRRLLGDPTRRVESGPTPSLASFLQQG